MKPYTKDTPLGTKLIYLSALSGERGEIKEWHRFNNGEIAAILGEYSDIHLFNDAGIHTLYLKLYHAPQEYYVGVYRDNQSKWIWTSSPSTESPAERAGNTLIKTLTFTLDKS